MHTIGKRANSIQFNSALGTRVNFRPLLVSQSHDNHGTIKEVVHNSHLIHYLCVVIKPSETQSHFKSFQLVVVHSGPDSLISICEPLFAALLLLLWWRPSLLTRYLNQLKLFTSVDAVLFHSNSRSSPKLFNDSTASAQEKKYIASSRWLVKVKSCIKNVRARRRTRSFTELTPIMAEPHKEL